MQILKSIDWLMMFYDGLIRLLVFSGRESGESESGESGESGKHSRHAAGMASVNFQSRQIFVPTKN